MAKMGRPRSFDRDEAINQAMMLFWEHGYESTSLSQLKAGMGGITAPSFYAAFGSKEALFREVVTRYVDTYGSNVTASLWDTTLPPKEAIELALRRSAKMQTERSHPQGCLLVLSASAGSTEHKHIQKLLADVRRQTREGFLFCIQRAINNGELTGESDPTVIAAMLDSFLLGFSTLARDGIPLTVLESSITKIMDILSPNVSNS
ncbi:TetR/AcrR family transcriptional regulator [Xenorhabdus sp. DI]|uniref:TetR/AcrR family transcriptional regulator n=1 Tax=Xenorhabdus doucetiae TaxID=351671 RepID=UPI0019B4BDC1|nr:MULTISPECIES: TetR/AcrR family transcriptional regulator [unclassified Xenorhabdus]MBD2783815.1 TetR/AcrR family transcriptional regulator [Xenorhabdus sp. 3]MBD2787036.1 TetR/AcrR family transcriptional regulator [Xenorhabdus sp. DI]